MTKKILLESQCDNCGKLFDVVDWGPMYCPSCETNPLFRQYLHPDPETLGEYYPRHVYAMAKENLHDKAEIAAELAFRDMRLNSVRAELATYRRWVEGGGPELEAYREQQMVIMDCETAIMEIVNSKEKMSPATCKRIARAALQKLNEGRLKK